MISKRTRRIVTATLLGVAFFTGFFVSNNKEITPENQDRIAELIAESIVSQFSM